MLGAGAAVLTPHTGLFENMVDNPQHFLFRIEFAKARERYNRVGYLLLSKFIQGIANLVVCVLGRFDSWPNPNMDGIKLAADHVLCITKIVQLRGRHML